MQEVFALLARVIREGEIRPLGSTQVRKVDVRLIAAASDDLRAQVEAGKFRQDLFYRLNVVTLALPPLRERKEDIAILASHFLSKMAERLCRKISGFKPDTVAYWEAHPWPGNVRELENVVERMVILAEQTLEYLPPDLLPQEIRSRVLDEVRARRASHNVKSVKENYEKIILLEALAKLNWNHSSAAGELGISARTVRYKMQKFGIKKP
jgi:transcriptional regulator with PAS, ATPase and Fis domain